MAKEFKIFVDDFECDVYDPNTLATLISYAIADLVTLDVRKNASTKEIKLPATARNQQKFGFPHDFNSQPNIDQTNKPVGKITADDISILKGIAKITATYENNGTAVREYLLVIQGDNGDWRARMNGLKINDIDYSDQNHVLNYATQLTSETVAPGREYVYDLIDRGQFTPSTSPYISTVVQPFNVLDSNGNLMWTNPECVRENDRYPALNVVGLLNRMYNGIGYKVESNWRDSTHVNKLYWPFVEEKLRHPDTFNDLQKFQAQSTTNYMNTVAAGNTQGYNTAVFFNNQISDPSNNFTGVEYIAPATAQYKFKFTGSLATTIHTGSTPGTAYITLTKTGPVQILHQVSMPLGMSQGITFETELIQLNFGERVVIELSLWLNQASSGLNRVEILAGAVFECTEVAGVCEVGVGQNVDMNINLPNVGQLDFLKGLKTLNNLMFLTDVETRTVYIEDYDNFFLTEAVEMSHKVDTSKQITTKFIGDQHGKVIRYQYKPDSNDKFVNEYDKQNTVPFGAVDVGNTNAYAKDVTEVFENYLFAATWMDFSPEIGFRGVKIPRMWNGVTRPAKTTKFTPRILVYDGVKAMPTNHLWYALSGTTVAVARSTYPCFYSYDNETENDNNLLYCDDDLNSGLQQKYFRNSHATLTAGRIWFAYMKLNDVDISNLNFRKPWYIELEGNGAYFIVNEVKDYNSTKPTTTLVELIKIIANVPKVALRRKVNPSLPVNVYLPPNNPTALDLGSSLGPATPTDGVRGNQTPTYVMRYGNTEIFRVVDGQVRVGDGFVYTYNDEGNVEQVFIEDISGNIQPVVL